MTFSGSDSRNGQHGRFWMNTTYPRGSSMGAALQQDFWYPKFSPITGPPVQ